MTEIELLRHVADNLENKRVAGHGLLYVGSMSCAKIVDSVCFDKANKYTLAPHTHMVNGFEVPAPLSVAPEKGQKYATVALKSPELGISYSWYSDDVDNCLFSRKLCFSTEDEARQNGLALLGYDPATTQVGDLG